MNDQTANGLNVKLLSLFKLKIMMTKVRLYLPRKKQYKWRVVMINYNTSNRLVTINQFHMTNLKFWSEKFFDFNFSITVFLLINKIIC